MTYDSPEGTTVHIVTISSSQMPADTCRVGSPLLLINSPPPNSTQSPPPDPSAPTIEDRKPMPQPQSGNMCLVWTESVIATFCSSLASVWLIFLGDAEEK